MGTAGRQRVSLEFNFRAHTIIGIDLGDTNMVGVRADLGGAILDEAALLSTPGGDKDGVP